MSRVTKHFVEGPGIGGHDFVSAAAVVGVFIQSDGDRFAFERRDADFVFLVGLIFGADVVRGTAHPINQWLVRVVGHLGGAREIEVGVVGIEVLANHVHVVEAVEQQSASPIGRPEVIGH